MALTRKFLSALGIEADKVDEIISAHTETVDGLKEQLKQFKEDAEKLPTVQKELDDLKTSVNGGEELQQKYDKLDKEFQDYRKEVETRETKAKIKESYKKLLKTAGVSDKRLDSVLRVTDFSAMQLDKDGNLESSDKLAESIKTEWADFIETEGTEGANPATPPDSNPSKPGNTGRAKELAQKYHANLYGAVKEGN